MSDFDEDCEEEYFYADYDCYSDDESDDSEQDQEMKELFELDKKEEEYFQSKRKGLDLEGFNPKQDPKYFNICEYQLRILQFWGMEHQKLNISDRMGIICLRYKADFESDEPMAKFAGCGFKKIWETIHKDRLYFNWYNSLCNGNSTVLNSTIVKPTPKHPARKSSTPCLSPKSHPKVQTESPTSFTNCLLKNNNNNNKKSKKNNKCHPILKSLYDDTRIKKNNSNKKDPIKVKIELQDKAIGKWVRKHHEALIEYGVIDKVDSKDWDWIQDEINDMVKEEMEYPDTNWEEMILVDAVWLVIDKFQPHRCACWTIIDYCDTKYVSCPKNPTKVSQKLHMKTSKNSIILTFFGIQEKFACLDDSIIARQDQNNLFFKELFYYLFNYLLISIDILVYQTFCVLWKVMVFNLNLIFLFKVLIKRLLIHVPSAAFSTRIKNFSDNVGFYQNRIYKDGTIYSSKLNGNPAHFINNVFGEFLNSPQILCEFFIFPFFICGYS